MRLTDHLPADECRGCSCQSSSAWLRIWEHSILRSMNMVTMASSVVTASVMMYWNTNQDYCLQQGKRGHKHKECSLRREAIRNALFLQRKVPENPHRKKFKCKIVGSEQNLSKLDKSDLYFIGFRLQVWCAVWAIMAHCELWLSSMFDQEHLG